MSRIAAVSDAEAGWFTKLVYRFAKRHYGAVPEPAAVTAHHPKLLAGTAVSELLTGKLATVLPAGVRELAVYRVATRIGCSWCVDFGTMLQRNEGLDTGRLEEIDDYEASERFTELDRLVIAYADAMTEQPMQVTDEQFAELDRRLGHRGMIELTFMISLENEHTRFNHALGITAQGFTSGEACAVPLP